ncbi:hypothetical protein BHM03_00035745, partial [Ensete ventricosum]
LDLTPPFVDDGLLEVVGFKDGWHGFVLLAPGGHGTRLAQFKFRKGAGDHAYMRIDGEPWKQPLPQDKDKVVVEISHLGQVSILATDNCIAKSVYDVSTQPDEESTSEDSDNSYSEERKKFGAADAFRYYDDIDPAPVPSLLQPQRRSPPPLPADPALSSLVLTLSNTVSASLARLGKILLHCTVAISVPTSRCHPVPQPSLLPSLYLFLFHNRWSPATIAVVVSHYSRTFLPPTTAHSPPVVVLAQGHTQ